MVVAGENPFGIAIAQCQGDFGLPLLNTWLSLGLHAAFLLLSFQGLAFMVRRATVARIPGFLHSLYLVSCQHTFYIQNPIYDCS